MILHPTRFRAIAGVVAISLVGGLLAFGAVPVAGASVLPGADAAASATPAPEGSPAPDESPEPAVSPEPEATTTPEPGTSPDPGTAPEPEVLPAPEASPAPTPTTGPAAPPADEPEPTLDQPDAVLPDDADAPTLSPSPTPTPPSETAAPVAPVEPSANSPPESPFRARADVSAFAAGVTEPATQTWIETFEQGVGTTPIRVDQYATSRYTGSAFWLNVNNCNGVVVNYNATFPATPFCTLGDATGSRFKVARMADVLGQVQANVAAGTVNPGGATDTTPVNGSTATTRANHGVTAMTSAAQGTQAANQVVLESVGAVGPTPATADRYYSMSIDVSEDSCAARPGGQNNNSRLDLALVTGTTVRPLTTAPIVACTVTNGRYTSNVFPADNQTDPWGTGSPSTRAGRFFTDTAVLLTPAQAAAARVRLTNQESDVAGNDFSFDNLRLLDSTPSLDKEFSPLTVPAGVASTLTFTVTNTTELAAKPDWGFTDALPAGLVVAPSTSGSPAIGGTCTSTTGAAYAVTAAEGSSTITVAGGDLAAGAASCTVTVAVLSNSGGTYTNGPSNVTTVLNAPDATTLTVEPPTTVTIRKNVVSRAQAADQFRLALVSGASEVASATTSGSALGLQTQQVGPVNVTRGATYTVGETVVTSAQLRTYTSSYECARGTTVIARGTSVSGSLTIPDEAGVSIVCTFTNTAQATASLYCDGSYLYSVRSDGALTQTNALSSSTSQTAAVIAAGPAGTANANSLAIDVEGQTAYAITRSTATNANTATGVITYSVSPSGTLTATRTAFATPQTLSTTASITMGAFDPVGRAFVVGTTSVVNNVGRINLWRFNGATANPLFTLLGYVSTGANSAGNGDMAFDAKGNLHILRSEGTQAQFFSVAGPALSASTGGEITATATTQRTVAGIGAGPLNGLAFSPRGTAYVGTGTNAYQFDPLTWTAVPNTPTIVLGTDAVPSTDLATCASPSTFSVSKSVLSRVTGQAHDFRLAVATGGSEVAFANTGTTGTSASIGPITAPVNTVMTISELLQTTAVTTAAVPATYTVIYECWADGVRIASARMDATRTASVTIPNQVSVGVACTIYNTAQPVAEIKVRKSTVDGLGANPRPAAGWTVGTSIASAGSGTVVLPADPASTGAAAGRSEVTTDANGLASFFVLYGSATGSATVSVLERQQTGFRLDSLVCAVTRGTATTSTTDTNSATDASGYAVRTVAGTIAPGNTVDCTFTNRPIATLTLVKRVSFGSTAPSAWLLDAARSVPAALAGPRGAGGSGTINAVPVSADTPYRLSESGGPATYVQVGDWSCVTATGATVPVTAAGDITLSRGSTVTCTVTNATASLTLLKNVQNPSTGFVPSTWNLTATPATLTGLTARTVAGADFQSAGNPASTFDVRPGHSYTLTEALAQSGTRLAYRQLRLELRQPNGSWTPVTSATITAPAAGQAAVYRFVNAPVAPTTLPLTGGQSTDAYLFSGFAVLALALALAVWHGRRRRRRSTA
ncbi:LPXTG cell wall anchor domain-containing protein [Herbiconiux sp. CPCC 205716]|uniref:LPXTG cell wall anchor domain-containing protein n=1 Tax=Herbiconiux gentiana TaxID=2970912 RepID=A0ABT2GGG3_9MICO|nr:LPXTG cell wall anchor domain-containing protein [Herbiconiux gentiana]MCS5715318.1 LPXTG cell wall anchor domain-containing protein [Herbiconiux gentiana]